MCPFWEIIFRFYVSLCSSKFRILIQTSFNITEFYRDIKGANLLVDAYGVVKLADFGMAKHVSDHFSIYTWYYLQRKKGIFIGIINKITKGNCT